MYLTHLFCLLLYRQRSMADLGYLGPRTPSKRTSRRRKGFAPRRSKEREKGSSTASPSSSPPPPSSLPLAPWRCLCGALCNGSVEFFDHTRVCTPHDMGTPVCSASDSANASVKSMRSEMLQSVRAAVASGHLEGDTLAAGVRVLQEAEEEVLGSSRQRQSGSLFSEAEPWRVLPRTFLPVSGSALLAAAGRRRERMSESAAGSYYTVVPDGLSCATRVAISHTYRPRAAFMDSCDNDDQNDKTSRGDSNAPISNETHVDHDYSCNESFTNAGADTKGFQSIQLRFNRRHKGMVHYVFKRFMPRDLDVSLDSVDQGANTGKDIPQHAKRRRADPMPQLEMDVVLWQERHRISRVPMPTSECYYPN